MKKKYVLLFITLCIGVLLFSHNYNTNNIDKSKAKIEKSGDNDHGPEIEIPERLPKPKGGYEFLTPLRDTPFNAPDVTIPEYLNTKGGGLISILIGIMMVKVIDRSLPKYSIDDYITDMEAIEKARKSLMEVNNTSLDRTKYSYYIDSLKDSSKMELNKIDILKKCRQRFPSDTVVIDWFLSHLTRDSILN